MKATILAIGDEIVVGTTTDTNSGFLAQLLRSTGVEVTGFITVADDIPAILTAFRRALEDADLVVTTGGLGPTSDDLTTACVADYAGVPLELDEPSLADIEERFRGRGLEMPANNRKQALFPRGAFILANPDGTAPGFVCEVPRPGGSGYIASMPGVPREMRKMAETRLLPWLAGKVGHAAFGARTYSVVGLTESRMDELMEGAIDPALGRLSFRAAFPRLQVRISVAGASEEEVTRRLEELDRPVRERLGDAIYGIGDVGLEETVGDLLRERKLTVAVAESCTGGLIGHRLTDVPGSSDYFLLGVVAYANEMKKGLLGVQESTLVEFGAVSEEVVREMAQGAREASGAAIGVATSGIAGPGGGTEAKPVGTVCIGIATPDATHSWTHRLGQRSRGWIKEMTAQLALDHLRRTLLEKASDSGD